MAPEMPHRDVQLRADRLARLAHLLTVIAPAGIDNGAAGTNGGIPERRGEILEQLEVRRFLEAPPTGDDDGRFGDVEHRGIGLLDPLRHRTGRERRHRQ